MVWRPWNPIVCSSTDIFSKLPCMHTYSSNPYTSLVEYSDKKCVSVTRITEGVALESVALTFVCDSEFHGMAVLESDCLFIHGYYFPSRHVCIPTVLVQARNGSTLKFGHSDNCGIVGFWPCTKKSLRKRYGVAMPGDQDTFLQSYSRLYLHLSGTEISSQLLANERILGQSTPQCTSSVQQL